MSAEEKVKNDAGNSRTDALADLPVTGEQADRATAGAANNRGKLIVGVDNLQVR